MFNAPIMVYEFLKNIKSCKYLFIAMTMGGNSGKTVDRVKKHLKVKLSASFSFMMPDNYIVWHEAMPINKQQKLIKTANEKIKKVSIFIQNKQIHFDDERKIKTNTPFIVKLIPKWLIQSFGDLGYKMIKTMDKDYNSTDKCNGCGTCVKVCPTNNIKLVDKRPVWNHNCEQCLACIQWCPLQAIEIKNKTVGKKRYHHPDIKLKDMI